MMILTIFSFIFIVTILILGHKIASLHDRLNDLEIKLLLSEKGIWKEIDLLREGMLGRLLKNYKL